MPFKSKSQMRACFAKKDPGWDCHKWAHETPNRKKLPERMKKMMGGKLRMMKKPCMECGGEFQDGGFYRKNPDYQMWPGVGQIPLEQPNLDAAMTPETNMFQQPQSPDQLQQAISRGLIQTPEGFASAQEAYGYYNTPAPKRKKRSPFDPIWKYDELKAVQNGLAFLSGASERGRQNQYLANQMSTLGQIDPVPVQNFQPSPYNLYARFGGSLRKYQKGGKPNEYDRMTAAGYELVNDDSGYHGVKWQKKATPQGRQPIYTDNPNDPRLRAYQDSLGSYKWGQDNYRKIIDSGMAGDIPVYSVADRLHLSRDQEAQRRLQKYREMGINVNEKDILDEMLNQDVINRGTGKKNQATDYYVFSRKDGKGNHALSQYSKPVQPVLYRKPEATHPYTKNVASNTSIPTPSNMFGSPDKIDIGGPQGPSNYAFQYRDDNGNQQVVYFPNSTEMAKFTKDQPWTSKSATANSWQISAPYLKRKKGGGINPAHKGWCTPMTKATCTGKRRQFALNMKKMARANKNHG